MRGHVNGEEVGFLQLRAVAANNFAPGVDIVDAGRGVALEGPVADIAFTVAERVDKRAAAVFDKVTARGAAACAETGEVEDAAQAQNARRDIRDESGVERARSGNRDVAGEIDE